MAHTTGLGSYPNRGTSQAEPLHPMDALLGPHGADPRLLVPQQWLGKPLLVLPGRKLMV